MTGPEGGSKIFEQVFQSADVRHLALVAYQGIFFNLALKQVNILRKRLSNKVVNVFIVARLEQVVCFSVCLQGILLLPVDEIMKKLAFQRRLKIPARARLPKCNRTGE